MKHNQIGTPGVFTERQQALLDHYGTRAESTFVELRDPALQAHVLHAGRGEPVVMVHGGNSVAVGMQPLFGQLAERFSVYAADRPGCGLTDSYVYRRTDMRRHGVAFIGSLLDQLGLETVALVGNSMGGFWCMAFALAHPERVSRLILLGEPAGSSPRVGARFQVLATPGLGRLLYATKLRPSPKAIRVSLAEVLVADIDAVPQAFLDLALAAATLPGATRAWVTMIRSCVRRFGESPLTHSLRGELGGLTTPTLFGWGDHDRLGEPRLGEEMAQLMPDARVAVIEGAGHLPWLDRPQQVLELVSGFLDPVARPARPTSSISAS